MSTAVNLKMDIAKLDSLPGMPAIAQKLLALALDTDEGEAELLKLIGQDPLISAKIIGLSNSAMFGASRKVSSVHDAAMLLGLTRVKSVALGIATMSAVTRLPEGQLKTNELWSHSLTIALAMRVITKAMPARTRPLDDQIFLSGLLHDIGYMALSFLDTKASDALHIQLLAQPERPITEIEQELLGMTHAEIGAHLGRHWIGRQVVPTIECAGRRWLWCPESSVPCNRCRAAGLTGKSGHPAGGCGLAWLW